MSQDGKLQFIPRDLAPNPSVAEADCSCGGRLYTGGTGRRFSRCTRGRTHCLRCGALAHRFRKGFVCNCR